MDGLHADVPKVISMSPANTEEDFRNLNKRIECYGKKVRNLTFIKIQFLFYWDSVLEIGGYVSYYKNMICFEIAEILLGFVFFGIINYDIF